VNEAAGAAATWVGSLTRVVQDVVSSRHAEARPAPMQIKGPILVIDANGVMARIVTERLGQIGLADVQTSTSLRHTLTNLETTRYGLVLCEYDTHPLTGFDLWRIITGREEWKTTPFILMADEERKRANITRFEEAGLPVVLAKPFSAEQLAASIELVTSGNPFSAFV